MKHDESKSLGRPQNNMRDAKPVAKATDRVSIAPTRKVLRRPESSLSRTATPRVPFAQLTDNLRSELFALEPRMLFDGAGMVAAVDVGQDSHIKDWGGKSASDVWVDAAHEAAAAYSASRAPSTLLVIDQSVNNWQTLAQGAGANVQVLVLDRGSDGLAQIAAAVSNRTDLASIQIISHGSDGLVTLGNRVIDRQALQTSQAALTTIGQSLAADGDLLLYGCDVARGSNGLAFINDLANATHADVAASNNLTGASAAGGDWVLEVKVGSVEAINAISASTLDAFSGLLPNMGVISGHLWDDTLVPNGLIDSPRPSGQFEENCFANQTVKLLTAGSDGIFGNSDDVEVARTTTGDGTGGTTFGVYRFSGLAAGNYRIMVERTFPDGQSGTVNICTDSGALASAPANDPSRTDGMIDLTLGVDQVLTDQNFGYLQTNYEPVISSALPTYSVVQNTPKPITGLAFSESGPPVGQTNTLYTVTLAATHGTLNLDTIQTGFRDHGDLAVIGGANGSSTITLRGDATAINKGLATTTYLNTIGAQGTAAVLSVTVIDNTGDGRTPVLGPAEVGNCIPNQTADTFTVTRNFTMYINDVPIAKADNNSTTSTNPANLTGNVIGVSGGQAAGSSGDVGDMDNGAAVSTPPLTICGVFNSTAPSGALIAPTTVGRPVLGEFGTLTLSDNGNYTYVLNRSNPLIANLLLGDTKTDVFHYCVGDTQDGTARTTLTITITGEQVAPVAKADTNSTTATSTVAATGNVLIAGSAGDRSDMDMNPSDTLTVCGVAPGTPAIGPTTGVGGLGVDGLYGKLTVNSDGSYSYVVDTTNPTVRALSTTGSTTDVFTYCVTDGRGNFDKTTLTITITGTNTAPMANPDVNSTMVGAAPAMGNVLGGTRPGVSVGDMADTDPQNDPLVVCGVAPGTPAAGPTTGVGTAVLSEFGYGSITIAADGTYTYTVNTANQRIAALTSASAPITDVFTYCLSDGRGGFDKTTVSITIRGPASPPVAQPDKQTINADLATPATGNVITGGTPAMRDSDPTNGRLSVRGVARDMPAGPLTGGVDTPILGKYGTIKIAADGTYEYVLNRNNPDVIAAKAGAVLDDKFSYTITDNKGSTATTTVTICITGINDCPVAVADTNTAPARDGSATTGNVLGGPGKSAGDKTDTDPDGDTLRVCGVAVGVVNNAANVTANVGTSLMGTYGAITVNADGSYRYVVDASKPGVVALKPGQTLTDTFTYCVTDGTCAPLVTTVVITLTGTNEPPTATGKTEMVPEGGAIVCDLAAVADPDNTPAELKVTIDTISNPNSGTFFLREPIAGQPGQFREVPVVAGTMLTGDQLTQLCFRPNPTSDAPRNPDGSLKAPVLTYTVTDPSGETARSAVTIMIKPPTRVDPPVVVPPVILPPVIVPEVPPVVPPIILGLNLNFPSPAPLLPFAPLIPSLVPALSLEPPLDSVGLFEPYTSLAQVDPRAPTAVKSVATVVPEKAVKADVDCEPTAKPKIKPKAVKRSVFAEAVAKPSAAFSEQLKDAKKRFKPPPKLMPKPALQKDC